VNPDREVQNANPIFIFHFKHCWLCATLGERSVSVSSLCCRLSYRLFPDRGLGQEVIDLVNVPRVDDSVVRSVDVGLRSG
jgi:hypothetical protein